MSPRAVRRALFAVCSAAALLISCDRQPAGPDADVHTRLARGVSFQPVFSRASQQASASGMVDFVKVRVRLERADGTVAVETTIDFPAGAESIPLALTVPLLPSTTANGEAMTLTMEYIDAAGVVVFTGGPMGVTILPSVIGAPPPPPIDVPVVYTGTGAAATKVVISPKTVSVLAGDPVAFTAQAFDASGTSLPGTPVVFSVGDATLLTLAANGTGAALTKRGTTTVTAQLLTGPSDNATVSVQLRASALAAISGLGQTGPVGVALPQPVKVRATASDGVGVQGVTVAFAAANNGSVGTASVVTDANGDAQTTWTPGPAPGPQSLTASAQGLSGSPVTFNATAIAGGASVLVVTTQPVSAASGANIGPVVVTARDVQGNVASTFTGAVTLTLNGGTAGAALTGAVAANAVAGVATFASLSVNRAGTGYTLSASSTGLSSATSNAFSITGGTATQLVFTGQPADATAGASIGGPIIVTARDAAGNAAPFSGTVSLLLASNGNGGTLSGTTSVTAVNGVATFTGASIDRTGSYQLVATAAGLTTGQSGSFSIVAGGAAGITVVSGGGQTAVANATLAPITVAVADAFGNAISGFVVGFAPAATNGSTTPTSATTNAQGRASTTWTLGAPVGTQTLNASGTGVPTLAITATAASSSLPATQLSFAVQPSNTTAGAAIAPSIVVTALDVNGALASSFTGNVTLAIGTNPGSGVLSGTLTAFATGGVATFTGNSINAAANGYTLTATSAGLTPATSAPFNITAAGIASVVFTTQPSDAVNHAAIAPAIVVTAKDAFGNVATGFTGSVALAIATNPSAGTLGGATTVSAVAGVATFANVNIDIPGIGYTLQATGATFTATSSAFNISAGLATQLAFTTTTASGTAGAPLAPAFVVAAKDAFGNLVTTATGSVTVAIANNAGGGVLSGTLTQPLVSGVATFPGLSVDLAGAGYTLSATSGSLTAGTSAAFNIVAGGIASLAFTTQPTDAGNHVVIAPPIVVTAKDAFGNTATSFNGTVTLTISTNPASGTLAGTTALNAASGVATFASVSIDNIGSGYVLQATANTFQATSNPFNILTGAPTHLAFSVQPTTTAATVAITPSVVVQVLDANNAVVTGFSGAVALAIGTNPSAGALSGTVTQAAVNGLATFPGISIAQAGTGYTLVASSGVLTQATSSAFDITAGGVTQLMFTTQPSNAINHTTIAPAIVVTAQDAQGNTVTSFTGNIDLGLFNNPSDGVLLGGTSIPAVNGVATFPNVSVDIPFSGYTIQATSGSLMAISNAFDIFVGAATQLTFYTPPFDNAVGNPFASPVQVAATDAHGYVVPTFTGNVTVAFGANPGGGSLGGTLTVAAASGIATFADLTVPNAGSGYTLVASASGFANITSPTFDISAGSNSWTNASGGLWSVGANWSAGHTPTSTEAVNITLAGSYTVTLDVAYTGLTLALGSGAPGQTLSLANQTLTLSGQFNIANGAVLQATNSNLFGTGTINNQGGTVILDAANATMNLNNSQAGSALLASNVNTLAGALTTQFGSTIQIGQLNTAASSAALVVGSSFTNLGTITLTNASSGGTFSATLGVNGTITNLGSIVTAAGAQGGGSRIISGAIDNQNTITIGVTTQMTATNAPSTNSGTITLNGGLTIANAGTSGWTNTASGTIALNGGQILDMNGGTFVQSGALGGPGTLSLSATTTTLNSAITPAAFSILGSTVTTAVSLSTASMAFVITTSSISGTGSITNASGQNLTVDRSDINVPLANQGVLLVSGPSQANGALTNAVGATLQVGQINAAASIATLNVASGFTNDGIITITNASSSGTFSSTLAVNSGTLTNSSTGSINVTGGAAAGGTRTIGAQLANQGTISLSVATILVKVGATHTNSGAGAITLGTGDLTLTLTGGATFTNSATINVTSGRNLIVSQGAFNHGAGGTLAGAGTLTFSTATGSLTNTISVGALVLTNSAVTYASSITTSAQSLSMTSSTLNAVSINNPSGQTTVIDNSTVNAPFTNGGTLTVSGSSAFTQSFTTATTSVINIGQINASFSTATMTMSNAFINNGQLRLTNASGAGTFSSALTMASGALTNSSSGTFTSSTGTVSGGARTFNGVIANAGTIITQANAPLAINQTGGTSTNTGSAVIAPNGANITFALTGGATLTNSAQIQVLTSRTFTVNGGTFNHNAGGASSINNGGTLSLVNTTASIAGPMTGIGFSASGSIISVTGSYSTATLTPTTLTSTTLATTGGFTIAASTVMTFDASTINGTFTNNGTLNASGVSALNGAVVAASGSIINVGQINTNASTALLTIASGFTNVGTINLTNLSASGTFSSQLDVTTGSLTNTGTIASLVGSLGGGTRTLGAQLLNSGTVTVSSPLTVNKPSAAHTNNTTGNIVVSGADLTVTQSGTTPSFTNTATINTSAGRTFTVSGGSFAHNAGTSAALTGAGTVALAGVTGSFTTGANPGTIVETAATTLTLGGTWSVGAAVGVLQLTSSTFTSTGLTIGAAATILLDNSTINGPVTNNGTVTVSGSTSLAGALTANSGSVINIGQINSSAGTASLTVANGFSNAGTINLTNATGAGAFASQIVVTTGTLTNIGTIATLAGSLGGGTRTIAAQISNLGTVNINAAASLAKASATHSNGGVGPINVNANLTITQSGTSPSFANSGPIAIASGASLIVSGGAFSHAPGTSSSITGAGSVIFSSVTNGTFTGATFTPGFWGMSGSTVIMSNTINTSATALSIGTSTVNGTGTINNNAGSGSMALDGSTLGVAFNNSGSVIVTDGSAMNGAVTTTAASQIFLSQQTTSANPTAALNIAAGFTNNGLIELTNSHTAAKNAVLTVTGTLTNSSTGELRVSTGTVGGTRGITATISNQGLIRLYQTGIGNAFFTGATTQTASGTLNLQIGGTAANTQYDVLNTTGNMNPGGTLTVTLANGFVPSVGQSFTIVNRGGGAGTFATLNLPTLPVGTWVPTFTASTIVLTVQ